MDHGVDIRDRGHRSGRPGWATGHYGTGGRGHVECRAAETASTGRVNLGGRSANVSHVQSVAGEELGDKLRRVTTVTAEPFECC
ncbi:hypothetical protein Adu01nite_12140 [Paractinoplanes durhamensis]|uniref:Uncharacterized protein n=1 Tax=Paractinoplanes durhamensis TaxID=113563 RepID=A0ABQ3YR65_9ACTN|nr:hypothetical protein Adu01nite_12140 [Actinoplanes durhamensis]